MRAGFQLTPDVVARYFPPDAGTRHVRQVEIAAGRKAVRQFATTVASATLRRFRAE